MTTYQTEQPTIPDANDVLMGSAAPTFKFEQAGDQLSGTIVNTRSTPERQWNKATKRSDGPIKTFPSGDTIYQIEVTLQTGLYDPTIDDDDGQRRIFITGQRAKTALRNAVRAAGADKILIGGQLTVRFDGTDPNSHEGKAREWSDAYAPPQQQTPPAQQQGVAAQPGLPAVSAPQPQQSPSVQQMPQQPSQVPPQPQPAVNGNGTAPQPEVQPSPPVQAPQPPQQTPQPPQVQPADNSNGNVNANGNGQQAPQIQVPQPAPASNPGGSTGDGQPVYDPAYLAQVQQRLAAEQPGQA